MTVDFLNAIYGYLDLLFIENKRLIKLCGSDAIDNIETGSKDLLDFIQDIPRLIPYYTIDNKEMCEIDESQECFINENDKKEWLLLNSKKIELEDRDGLLEFNNIIDYLKKDYEDIINENKLILIKSKIIRNKYEHKIHDVKSISCYTGNDSWFKYGFKVKEKVKKDNIIKYEDNVYYIESNELIILIKKLNILFDKIVRDISYYGFKNKENHPFFRKIDRIHFLNFNKIYDSNILYEVGSSFNNL